MFLVVSGTVWTMEKEQRDALAKAITARRKTEFGTKAAAYKKADLNAATWDRAEAGLPIRDDRMTAVIKTLWPKSGGDPELISGDPTDWTDWPFPEGEGPWRDNDDQERGERLLEWIASNFVRINERLSELEEAIGAKAGESSDPADNLAYLRDVPSAANPPRKDPGTGSENA